MPNNEILAHHILRYVGQTFPSFVCRENKKFHLENVQHHFRQTSKMSEEKDPLPSYLEKINRNSHRDTFIFKKVTLGTDEFQSPKQVGFTKGET